MAGVKRNHNAAEVDGLFIALNEAIAQKDEALMVGHSYFMLNRQSRRSGFPRNS